MIRDNVHISENSNLLAQDLANYFQDMIAGQFPTREKINIAISGGNTPKLFFEEIAKLSIDFPWEKIHIFWVDERCVPPGDAASNYGMTKRVLLDKINIPKSNVHRVLGESDPDSEAKRYGEEINHHVYRDNIWPEFDWILLGIGEDGHTASLFPKSPLFEDTDSISAVATHPQTKQKRITLTPQVLNHAKRIAFLVSGASKAEVVAEILNFGDTQTNLPAALVKPLSGTSEWFLDEDAARNLS
jgi:6-phosphogluconolactonase